MAAVVGAAAVQGALQLQPVLEGFLEVLARLLLKQPHAFAGLLGDSAEVQSRFLDMWLSIAATRYLEELLGSPAIRSVARLRRHLAAVSLSALIVAGASPALHEPRRIARALAVGVRALNERGAFQVGFLGCICSVSK